MSDGPCGAIIVLVAGSTLPSTGVWSMPIVGRIRRTNGASLLGNRCALAASAVGDVTAAGAVAADVEAAGVATVPSLPRPHAALAKASRHTAIASATSQGCSVARRWPVTLVVPSLRR